MRLRRDIITVNLRLQDLKSSHFTRTDQEKIKLKSYTTLLINRREKARIIWAQ